MLRKGVIFSKKEVRLKLELKITLSAARLGRKIKNSIIDMGVMKKLKKNNLPSEYLIQTILTISFFYLSNGVDQLIFMKVHNLLADIQIRPAT